MEFVDCSQLALKKTRISGNVLGMFGTFEVEQVFVNNTKDILEVNYTFPIIDTATIIVFFVEVGKNTIKGICKDKKEAYKEYHQNIFNGNSAYILNKNADNIFNILIGKVAQGEEVKIRITYIDFFKIIDNEITVCIPTLITPKYKSIITENLNYGKVNYKADFNICISSLINFSKIESKTHKIIINKNECDFFVQAENCDMSKDFCLSIKLKEELSSNGIYSKNKDGEDIVCLSFMPEILDKYEDSEKEYIFIVDVSGSMQGKKLQETKRAIKQCLRQLDEGDKFNIIPFESTYSAFKMDSINFNAETLKEAEKFIDSLEANGGTEILLPIKFALYEQSDNKILLLFTDGQVGNENEILKFISQNIKESKIFAFGIDDNINTSFIKNISKVGNGKAEFIYPDEKIDNKILRTFARIQTPLVEELTVSYGQNEVLYELKEENRLFNYEFYNVVTKIKEIKDDICLNGKINGERFEWKIAKESIKLSYVDLEKIFVKLQIDRLEEYIKILPLERKNYYEEMIIELSKKYQVATKYTTFISVYEREDKIFEIPKVQNIILSDEFIDKERATSDCIFSSFDMDIPTFLRKNKKIIDNGEDNIYLKIEEYFKTKTIDRIDIFILFAIYFYKKQKYFIKDIEIINILNKNFEIIKNNKMLLDLTYLLYKNSTEEVQKYIYNNLFNYEYKKIATTNVNYKLDINLKKLPKSQFEENIDGAIDRVLWSLI